MQDHKNPNDGTKDTSFTKCFQNDKTVDQDGKQTSQQPLDPVTFLQLYRFTSLGDRLSLLLAVIAVVTASTIFPVVNIISGSMAELLIKRDLGDIECNGSFPLDIPPSSAPSSADETNVDIFDKIFALARYMIALGIVHLVSGYLFISLFHRVAEKMAFRLRKV
ncbi:unnamed protein product, partial [Allacma fusca]